MKTYLWTIVVFVFAKVVFMLCCQAGHAFSIGDMWQVIIHGLTLDLSTALYFSILPFLLVLVSLWHIGKWISIVLHIYFAIISLAFILAFVADTSLYPFWNFKLDATCLQYLETPTDAMASVSTGYLLGRLAILVILSILVFLGYTRPKTIFLTVKHRIAGTLAGLISIPLIVIGIRGGIDESTTNIGQVYFSQNQFLNHSAINPVFSFLASFEKTATENTTYHFYTPKEMAQLTKGLYDSKSLAGDTLLTTQRPNVVVILLESCGKMFQGVMPNLYKAADEGVDFTNCFGNSYRTDRGTVSALSGYLSFPTMSVMKMATKVGHISSIARTLQKEGYDTEYLYGGDINFTNMKGYLISTGFERLYWKQNYTVDEQSTAKWGVCDEITFKTLSDMILRHDDDKPFLIGYSTLSSHEPWTVPMQRLADDRKNAFAYTDSCLAVLIDSLKRMPVWDSLLVIIVPDHGVPLSSSQSTSDYRVSHIPMVWIGGAVKSPHKEIDIMMSQSDIAATLLSQMQLDSKPFPFSRNVLSPQYTSNYHFAVHCFKNGCNLIDAEGATCFECADNSATALSGSHGGKEATFIKAMLQHLYKTTAAVFKK